MLSGRFLAFVGFFVCGACSSSGTHGDGSAAGHGGGSGKAGAGTGGASGSGNAGAGTGGGGMAGSPSSAGMAGGGAGSAGTAGIAGVSGAVSDDDALVIPRDVTIMGLPGGHGVLEMFALTIRKGPTNTEMYAALKNVGDGPVCDGALTIELYDKDGMSMASGIGGLLTDHLYRILQGEEAGSIAACVDAGETTMASMTDLSPDIDIDNIGTAVYRNPYFGIQVEQIQGFTVKDVIGTPSGTGTSYTGTLVNGLDAAVTNPSVLIYPTNRVGRPLGMATANDPAAEIAPGGSWSFTSNAVDAVGSDYHAYVTASVHDTAAGGQGGQGGQAGQGGATP